MRQALRSVGQSRRAANRRASIWARRIAVAPLSAQTGPWAKYDADLKGGALVREASAGNLAEVRSIVEGGGNPNWGAGGELTPLLAAAYAGHADVVALLLEAGGDPTLRWRFNGKDALELARMQGHDDVVAVLQGASQGLPPPGVLGRAGLAP